MARKRRLESFVASWHRTFVSHAAWAAQLMGLAEKTRIGCEARHFVAPSRPARSLSTAGHGSSEVAPASSSRRAGRRRLPQGLVAGMEAFSLGDSYVSFSDGGGPAARVSSDHGWACCRSANLSLTPPCAAALPTVVPSARGGEGSEVREEREGRH